MKDENKSFSFGLKFKLQEKDASERDFIQMTTDRDGTGFLYHITFLYTGNTPASNFTVKLSFGKSIDGLRSKSHGFSDESSARAFMLSKYRSKLRRGYKEIKKVKS